MRNLVLPLCLFVVAPACDESPSAIVARSGDAESSVGDSGVNEDMLADTAVEADALLEPDAAPQRAAWVELALSPRRSTYQLTTEVTAEAAVIDAYGEPIEGALIEFTATPDDVVSVAADGAVTFLKPGFGTITACHESLCAETNFQVDDGPPTLTITAPERGQVFQGDDERVITVSGAVDDQSPAVGVTVNGEPVELADDGRFSTEVRLSFGANRIDITADDGVSRAVTRDLRDVMWAQVYVAPDERSVSIPRTLQFRMDQSLFDGGPPIEVPNEAAAIDIESISQLLEVVFTLAELDDLLDPGALLGGEDDGADAGDLGGFAIDGAELGNPEIDFLVTDEGLELFVRFGGVRILTSGDIDLQGQAIDLTGSIELAIVARVTVELALNDRVQVEVGEAEVAVENIEADFAAEGLGALINAASGGLTAAIEEAFSGVVNDIIRAQLADFVQEALFGLFGNLQSVPIDLDPMLPGVSPIALNISLVTSSIRARAQDALRFEMDLTISHTEPPPAREDQPGVPTMRPGDWPEVPGTGLGVNIQVALFNALLYEVWRGGLLNLTVDAPPEVAALLERVGVDARLPPVVAPAQGPSILPLEIQMGELIVGVYKPMSDIADTYVVSLRAGMNVGFADNSIVLELDEVPSLRTELLEARTDSPLPAALLESAVQTILWSQIRDAFTGGLDFGFGEIDIDPASLAQFAPRVNSLSAVPTFGDELVLRDALLILDGALAMQLGVSAVGAEGEADEGQPDEENP